MFGWISESRVGRAILFAGLVLVSACASAQADPLLQANLAIRTREPGHDFPPKLVTEVSAHLHRTIRDIQILNTSKGIGRLALIVAFPQDERLKFEKMVVELPTVTFTVPIVVDNWNINYRVESVGSSDETSAAASINDFRIEFDKSGATLTAYLKDVSLRDVLAFLARTSRLQYMCPADVAERTVFAHVRSVTVDDFMKELKTALGVNLQKVGSCYIFSVRKAENEMTTKQ